MHAALGLPVALEWDVAAAALAESARVAADDVLFVSLGTGVASAHVVGGVARRGATGRAGELGHAPVYPDGDECACGQRGCLEAYASATAIARRYHVRTGTQLATIDIAARVESDPDATAVWDEAVDALGVALATQTMVTDPGVIVLGGGLAEAGDLLIERVRAALAGRLTWRTAPPILAASLGDAAGMHGAAALAWRLFGAAEPAPITWPGKVHRHDNPRRSAGGDPAADPRPGLGRDPARADRPTSSPAPPRRDRRRCRADGRRLLPGFVDVHVHGGGGADITKGAEDMAAAVAFHRARGTTTTLVSLMAQPVELMCEQLEWAAALTRSGEIAGVHLEGPFLAAARCGAQRPESLLLPDPLVLRKLLDAGQGCVRSVTVAPELPGALDLIGELVANGVVAAIGHTDATYAEAMAGIQAGATLATHLFNAMRPFNHREPGAAIAALDAGVHVEMVNDGVHVHDSLTRIVGRSAPHALTFITDAISATGMGDGEYTLGEQSVVVRHGAARLASTDQLAGSTLTLDVAVRRAVQPVGLSLEVASAAASGNPARVLGVAGTTGAIAPGLAADLVVLDTDLHVQRVMRHGSWL